MATPPPAVYGSMISARSRRLRTIGGVLLIAILAMVIYGTTTLMPSLRRSVAATPIRVQRSTGEAIPPRTPEEEHRRKATATQIVFAYSYWAFCGVLVISAVFVAYLDFREVSRNYLTQRKAIWSDISERSQDA